MASYGTSTSTHSIGHGPKSFVVASGLPIVDGQFLRFAVPSSPGTYVAGAVTDYTDDLLTIAAIECAGTGTFSSWTVSDTGVRGVSGPEGAPAVHSELDFAQAISDFDIPSGTGYVDLPGLNISFVMPNRPVMLKMGLIARYVGAGDGILELVETSNGNNVVVEVHTGSSEQSGDWKQLYTERRITAEPGKTRSFKVRGVRRPITYRVAGAYEYPQWIAAHVV